MKSMLISMTLIGGCAFAMPALAQGDDTTVAVPPPDNTVVVAQPGPMPQQGDVVVVQQAPPQKGGQVMAGPGLNLFGAMGTTDAGKLGFGGRIEYVQPVAKAAGIAIGGSFTQYYGGPGSNYSQANIRPLLGEIGIALSPVRGFEFRPMAGVGYTWIDVSTSNQVFSFGTSGFDFAPGAKISYIANKVEVYTLPKWHILENGNDFFGLEVGAGARF
jgi:hypothetical protein